MKSATISELKKELSTLDFHKIQEICLRLAKYKKDNKELLTYLLFEADNEKPFLEGVKQEIKEGFAEMNKSNVYFSKKSVRKILRNTNKRIKYSGSTQTEAELLIYFVGEFKKSGIKISESVVLTNLFNQLVKKIEKAISTLHEDLQYDYAKELSRYQ